MCGIAGFITPNRFPRATLTRIAGEMSDQLQHRGPDAEGHWIDEEVGLAFAHRRLAIVDLSPNGEQPMISSNGQWILVYNGEIYNAEQIRKELNVSWKGSSDTEVILEAISAWGVTRTVNKLIGMFAFAIWHRKTRTLTLARDRLGIKPLYWSKTERSFIFASELKAVRKHPDSPTELNRNAISGFLRNCYISNPQTILTGVNQLEPGWLLHLAENSSKPVFEQYWSLKEVASRKQKELLDCSPQNAIDKLDCLLGDAVKRRMIADVPLGAFLSGGIDSSAVAAQMQKHSAKPVKTFSIGFENPEFDESSTAAAVASHLGTDHTQLIVTAEDALNIIPELPKIYDEPFADASQIPTYLLSRLTKEHVTVSLSGDGGDELFAGYNRYFEALKFAPLLKQPKILRHLEAHFLERVDPDTIRKYLPNSIANVMQPGKLQRAPPFLRAGTEISLYRQILSRIEAPSELLINCPELESEKWADAEQLDLSSDRFATMQYLDLIDYLPDDILTKVDRASMASSLEVRVPVLDHRIVEFSWSLPENLKFREGSSKWILKQVLYRYAPENLFDRPKKGFSVPIAEWLRGPLKEWANELLSNDSLTQTNVFKTKPLQAMWQDHLSKKCDWSRHIWDVLMLQSWLIENKPN